MPPAWIGNLNAMVKPIVALVTMVTGLHLATQWCTKGKYFSLQEISFMVSKSGAIRYVERHPT